MSSQIEITKDELDQRQFDATVVDGLDLENKHYRWVSKKSVNMTRKKLQGYVVTTRSPDMVHVVNDTTPLKAGESVADSYEWGDMILMECSREVFEERLGRKRARILRQTQGVAQAYKNAIARMSESAGQKNLGYEEHTDKGGYRETVSASDFERQMKNDPEVEDSPRIGAVR